jgi:group I intron endonuclease
MIGIYKITSPSGKIYIGQSTNIPEREKHYKRITPIKKQTKIFNSLNKHGWDKHIFEIIEECSIDKLDKKETYWKQYYLDQVEGDWDKVLFLSIYDSGGGPKEQHIKDKMSLNIKKAKQRMTDERRQEIGNNISQGHSNMTDEEKQRWGEKISQNHNNMSNEDKSNWGNKIKEKKTGHDCYKNPERGKKIAEKTSRPILQYDLEGNFIKEWKSLSEAGRNTNSNIGSISMVVNGTLKTAGGFIWKFK